MMMMMMCARRSRVFQAAVAHTNLPNKLGKEDVAKLSGLMGHLERLDPSKPDEVDLKVSWTLNVKTTVDVSRLSFSCAMEDRALWKMKMWEMVFPEASTPSCIGHK